VKKDANGNDRYKARLVARGFSQKEGIDYDETFPPVVRRETFRLLISLAVELKLNMCHMDVKTAFLHGGLHEVVFMKQPKSFVVKGEETKICLLQKSIYALKQASRMWNRKIHSVLIGLKFRQSKHETCVYYFWRDKTVVIIALYVDDHFILSNDEQKTLEIKRALMSEFEMVDLGKTRLCLGMNISYDETGSISLDQKHYIKQLLDKFEMYDAKPAKTPLEKNSKLEEGDKENLPDVPYQSLIGCVMYIAISTRPDVCYTVGCLSQFNTCYTIVHYKYTKRVLRYLKGTCDRSLVFSPKDENIVGFVDADCAGCSMDRRSYSGFIFKLRGGAVSWGSKKQNCIALSSTESEYIAIPEGAKEAIHLKGLLDELMNVNNNNKVIIHCDNQGAVRLAHNLMFHKSTKHIEVRYTL
jgi:hypothetical protein